jgi:hypothetical protein
MRNGSVANGHPSQSHSYSAAVQKQKFASPSQLSQSSRTAAPDVNRTIRTARTALSKKIAPLHLANRFALLESADSALALAHEHPLPATKARTESEPTLKPATTAIAPSTKTNAPTKGVRFSRKIKSRTYTATQPLFTPTPAEIARPAPARSCMRWSPPQTKPTPIAHEQFGLSSFRTHGPKGSAHTTAISHTACADCFFTINNASGGAIRNHLLRITVARLFASR